MKPGRTLAFLLVSLPGVAAAQDLPRTPEQMGYTQAYDLVIRTVDPDTHTLEIIFTGPIHTKGGPPFEMVETTFRRRNAQ